MATEYYQSCAFKKPEPTKRTKGRKDRKERVVKRDVRSECVDRDGGCRLFSYDPAVKAAVGPCEGPIQWAHLGDKKRARTRGQAPELRHTTAGSLMACQRHHEDYDQGRTQIEPLTPAGADGPLRAGSGDHWCEV